MLVSQSELHLLLKKSSLTSQEMQKVVLGIRSGCYDLPDASFEYCYKLLLKYPNSSEKLVNVDEMIHSGLQMSIPSSSLKVYLKWFINKLGKVPYLEKLSGFINFVMSPPDTQHLIHLLKEDQNDLDTRKRAITISKRQGNMDEYVKKINTFLQENPNDEQAWVELAMAYTERGQYMRAIFCFQELQILVPDNDHYTTRLGELYYTLGGKENITTAIKYLSFVIAKLPNHYRALWALNSALNSAHLADSEDFLQLRKKTEEGIKKGYSDCKSPIKVSKQCLECGTKNKGNEMKNE